MISFNKYERDIDYYFTVFCPNKEFYDMNGINCFIYRCCSISELSTYNNNNYNVIILDKLNTHIFNKLDNKIYV